MTKVIKEQFKNKFKDFCSFAFTLAEVIIVIGIIGVVAELTIPEVIGNFQKDQYIVSLKKFYTNFNQALSMMAMDAGCTGNLKCTGLFDSGSTDADLFNALSPYFRVINDCGNVSSNTCFPSPINQRYDGTGTSSPAWGGTSWYRFVTSDGMSYMINNLANGCAALATGTAYLTQNCAQVYVDINGFKSPNRSGKDIFLFYISNGRGPLLYPYGGEEGTSTYIWNSGSATGNCSSDAANAGSYCAAQVIGEGWQITYY